MGMLFIILGGAILLVGVCLNLYILYEAFQDETWKGLVGFFFPLYLLYWALVEFEHDRKWPIVIGSIVSSWIGGALIGAGVNMLH